MVKKDKTTWQNNLEKELKLAKSRIIKIQGSLANLLHEEIYSKNNYHNISTNYKKRLQTDKRKRKLNLKRNIKKLKTQIIQLRRDFEDLRTLPLWFDDLDTIIKTCFEQYSVDEEFGSFIESEFDFDTALEPLNDVLEDIKKLETSITKNEKIKISSPKPIIWFNDSGVGYVDGQKFTLQKDSDPYIVFREVYKHINNPVSRDKIIDIIGMELDGTESRMRMITYRINQIVREIRNNTGLTPKNIVLNKDLTLIGDKK